MADHASSTPARPVQGAIPIPLFKTPSERAQRLLAGMQRLAALAEEMSAAYIRELDRADTDPDLEPSLGSLEDINQRAWAIGFGGDLEGEHDGREPPEDDEYTLGRAENVDQSRQFEHGSEDGEPSLASIGSTWGPQDQTHWGNHRDGSWAALVGDGEEQCEDEGGACEDEGQPEYETVNPGFDCVQREFMQIGEFVLSRSSQGAAPEPNL